MKSFKTWFIHETENNGLFNIALCLVVLALAAVLLKYGCDYFFPINYTPCAEQTETIQEINPYSFVQLISL